MDISREAAYKILLKIEKDDSFSNLAINEYIASKRDVPSDTAKLIRRLVYGTLENRIYIDWVLDKLIHRGVKSTKKEALTILRLGAYQLQFMDSIPDYAAISTSVDLAKKYAKGQDKFVNGILRALSREKDSKELSPDAIDSVPDRLSIKYSFHRDIVDLIIDQRGEDAERIIKEIYESAENRPLTVRVIDVSDNAAYAISELEKAGYKVEPGTHSNRILKLRNASSSPGAPVSIDNLDIYKKGLISIQSEESCWIADNLNPSPGDRVLDLCAAPGGKTIAMAERMKNKGEIIACDIYEHRLKLIEKYADRVGIDIVKTLEFDGTKSEPKFEPLWDKSFDKVLVDAPCSGLGVMGRKPEIKLKPPRAEALIEVQKKLLENAGKYVKPGGTIAYSTCSIDKRENEEIVQDFLANNSDYELAFEKSLNGFYLALIK